MVDIAFKLFAHFFLGFFFGKRSEHTASSYSSSTGNNIFYRRPPVLFIGHIIRLVYISVLAEGSSISKPGFVSIWFLSLKNKRKIIITATAIPPGISHIVRQSCEVAEVCQ